MNIFRSGQKNVAKATEFGKFFVKSNKEDQSEKKTPGQGTKM